MKPEIKAWYESFLATIKGKGLNPDDPITMAHVVGLNLTTNKYGDSDCITYIPEIQDPEDGLYYAKNSDFKPTIGWFKDNLYAPSQLPEALINQLYNLSKARKLAFVNYGKDVNLEKNKYELIYTKSPVSGQPADNKAYFSSYNANTKKQQFPGLGEAEAAELSEKYESYIGGLKRHAYTIINQNIDEKTSDFGYLHVGIITGTSRIIENYQEMPELYADPLLAEIHQEKIYDEQIKLKTLSDSDREKENLYGLDGILELRDAIEQTGVTVEDAYKSGYILDHDGKPFEQNLTLSELYSVLNREYKDNGLTILESSGPSGGRMTFSTKLKEVHGAPCFDPPLVRTHDAPEHKPLSVRLPKTKTAEPLDFSSLSNATKTLHTGKTLWARLSSSDVDSPVIPSSPQFKALRRALEKYNSPDPEDKDIDMLTSLKTAAEDYLKYKDPGLDEKRFNELNDYEKSRIQFARDTLEFASARLIVAQGIQDYRDGVRPEHQPVKNEQAPQKAAEEAELEVIKFKPDIPKYDEAQKFCSSNAENQKLINNLYARNATVYAPDFNPAIPADAKRVFVFNPRTKEFETPLYSADAEYGYMENPSDHYKHIDQFNMQEMFSSEYCFYFEAGSSIPKWKGSGKNPPNIPLDSETGKALRDLIEKRSSMSQEEKQKEKRLHLGQIQAYDNRRTNYIYQTLFGSTTSDEGRGGIQDFGQKIAVGINNIVPENLDYIDPSGFLTESDMVAMTILSFANPEVMKGQSAMKDGAPDTVASYALSFWVSDMFVQREGKVGPMLDVVIAARKNTKSVIENYNRALDKNVLADAVLNGIEVLSNSVSHINGTAINNSFHLLQAHLVTSLLNKPGFRELCSKRAEELGKAEMFNKSIEKMDIVEKEFNLIKQRTEYEVLSLSRNECQKQARLTATLDALLNYEMAVDDAISQVGNDAISNLEQEYNRELEALLKDKSLTSKERLAKEQQLPRDLGSNRMYLGTCTDVFGIRKLMADPDGMYVLENYIRTHGVTLNSLSSKTEVSEIYRNLAKDGLIPEFKYDNITPELKDPKQGLDKDVKDFRTRAAAFDYKLAVEKFKNYYAQLHLRHLEELDRSDSFGKLEDREFYQYGGENPGLIPDEKPLNNIEDAEFEAADLEAIMPRFKAAFGVIPSPLAPEDQKKLQEREAYKSVVEWKKNADGVELPDTNDIDPALVEFAIMGVALKDENLVKVDENTSVAKSNLTGFDPIDNAKAVIFENYLDTDLRPNALAVFSVTEIAKKDISSKLKTGNLELLYEDISRTYIQLAEVCHCQMDVSQRHFIYNAALLRNLDAVLRRNNLTPEMIGVPEKHRLFMRETSACYELYLKNKNLEKTIKEHEKQLLETGGLLEEHDPAQNAELRDAILERMAVISIINQISQERKDRLGLYDFADLGTQGKLIADNTRSLTEHLYMENPDALIETTKRNIERSAEFRKLLNCKNLIDRADCLVSYDGVNKGINPPRNTIHAADALYAENKVMTYALTQLGLELNDQIAVLESKTKEINPDPEKEKNDPKFRERLSNEYSRKFTILKEVKKQLTELTNFKKKKAGNFNKADFSRLEEMYSNLDKKITSFACVNQDLLEPDDIAFENALNPYAITASNQAKRLHNYAGYAAYQEEKKQEIKDYCNVSFTSKIEESYTKLFDQVTAGSAVGETFNDALESTRAAVTLTRKLAQKAELNSKDVSDLKSVYQDAYWKLNTFTNSDNLNPTEKKLAVLTESLRDAVRTDWRTVAKFPNKGGKNLNELYSDALQVLGEQKSSEIMMRDVLSKIRELGASLNEAAAKGTFNTAEFKQMQEACRIAGQEGQTEEVFAENLSKLTAATKNYIGKKLIIPKTDLGKERIILAHKLQDCCVGFVPALKKSIQDKARTEEFASVINVKETPLEKLARMKKDSLDIAKKTLGRQEKMKKAFVDAVSRVMYFNSLEANASKMDGKQLEACLAPKKIAASVNGISKFTEKILDKHQQKELKEIINDPKNPEEKIVKVIGSEVKEARLQEQKTALEQEKAAVQEKHKYSDLADSITAPKSNLSQDL